MSHLLPCSLLLSALLLLPGLAGAQAIDVAQPLEESLTGTYYPKDQPGQGLAIEIRPDGSGLGTFNVFVAYFGYGDDGDSHWLAGNTIFHAGALEAVVPVFTLYDGDFASALEPATLRRAPFGTLTLRFNACRTAFVELDPVDHVPENPFPRVRDRLTLSPLLLPSGAACLD